MKNAIILQLSQMAIFKSFTQNEVTQLVETLQARPNHYPKGILILREGEVIERMGVIIEGSVSVQRANHAGNTHLITHLKKGDLVGEVFMVAGVTHSMVAVRAEEECTILWIGYQPKQAVPSITQPLICRFQLGITQNIAQKALNLQNKLFVLSQVTLKSKVLALLLLYAPVAQPIQWFTLPLSRQKMANYLCVNRSALSRALSQIKGEGVIDFKGNRFLLRPLSNKNC
jgi:CRP-like cAMP-binding protein